MKLAERMDWARSPACFQFARFWASSSSSNFVSSSVSLSAAGLSGRSGIRASKARKSHAESHRTVIDTALQRGFAIELHGKNHLNGLPLPPRAEDRPNVRC